MRFDSNPGRSVDYEPNSFGGPSQTDEPLYGGMETGDLSGSYDPDIRDINDFAQAGDLYRLMSADEQDRLVAAIAGSLAGVRASEVGDGIVERSIEHFRNADPEYGERVRAAVEQLRG